MKYNSIVKVDNLGRIVIPKKVRKLLNVKEKDYLTLAANEEEIILMHINKEEKHHDLIEKINKINKTYNIDFIISDNNKIIYTTKNYVDFKNEAITEDLDSVKKNAVDTKLNKELIINKPHHYCSIFYDNYTDVKLFIIFDDENKEQADFAFMLLK